MSVAQDNLRAYFEHLETSTSARGRAYHPSTANVIARCLGVCLEAFITEGPAREGESRKQRRRRGNDLQNYLRALSKSVRDKLSQLGGDFIDEDEIEKDQRSGLFPLSVQEFTSPFADSPYFLLLTLLLQGTPAHSGADAGQKVEVLPENPAFEGEVPKAAGWGKPQLHGISPCTHERRAFGLLANDFMMQTLERPATVHRLIMHRHLAINRAGLAVYVPTGASPSKTEARKRMSRHYFCGEENFDGCVD